jgi:DNA ligase (NAD+)
MIGININKLQKVEKNQKIKEGPCIFPFKYKRQEHNECVKTPKGDICATEINKKTKTLIKYGYCKTIKKDTKKNSKSSLKKSTKKKTLKTLKTLKIQKPKKLKEIKPIKKSSEKKMPRLNEQFMNIMGELKDIMKAQGERFRAGAYQNAEEAIMQFETDITHPDDLKGIEYIGSTILSKLNEYFETGTLKILERERKNPVNLFVKIYGVGAKTAKDLVKDGYTTIKEIEEAVKENPKLLNNKQKIGLKYYDAINERIPRDEINVYKQKLETIFKEVTPKNSEFQIVGSYRRGAKSSGDIDIIITNSDNNHAAFTAFLDKLIEDKIIIEVLNRGLIKSLTIAELPGKTPRRVDFLYTPPKEFAFALLYFTGSKVFNTFMRQRALSMGYTLNEHSLSEMKNKVKGKQIVGDFKSEKSIFDFLNMEYKNPENRTDGRAVEDKKSIEPSESSQPSQPSQSTKSTRTLRNRSLKKKLINVTQLIDTFKQKGPSFLSTLVEHELSEMIKHANDMYYCKNTSVMTDNQYDMLREYTIDKFPYNKVAFEGHVGCNMEATKNKVTLPYEMWSMDKIKPDTEVLNKWKKKYKGPYILSAKLDGVSGLYSTEKDKPALYTRGNGVVGQDISHLIPHLDLPTTKGITIRGEFIISKETFKRKYAANFASARNLVAGIVNQKAIEPHKFKDINFVAYETIKPELKPSEQFEFLEKESKKSNMQVVKHFTDKAISNELLSELLIDWRENYEYDVDGVIVANNKIYPRKRGNPEHAFAFKMVLSDQVAESKVVDIMWTPSKDGYLKPRIELEPVILGGSKVKHATGFNAQFIKENKVGIGSLIRIVLSGDVIPHIEKVIEPAEEALMPDVPYYWNATGVDIILKDIKNNAIVNEKIILGFFTDVEGFGPGTTKKLIKGGYDSIAKILAMDKDDYLSIDGFKDKTATKLYDGIKKQVERVNIYELMNATNLFGRGFGEKKLKLILTKYPDILTSDESKEDKIEMIAEIRGIAGTTATQFVNKIKTFLAFVKEAKLEDKLQQSIQKIKSNKSTNKSNKSNKSKEHHDIYGKKIVMTGFRDKDLITMIEEKGGNVSSSVTSKTNLVLVKTMDTDTTSTKTALKLGILIMTLSDFKDKYKL